MNRKAKIALNLSAISLALAVGAQFYTNHKIDQALQQFPYHFKDQLTFHIEEKSSNFFQRNLSLSLVDEKQQKTEIIQTQLTALPFAIFADSEIPLPLIRKLNQQLGVTIDENKIQSKFSVIGDYFQSDMETQFRDFTNKPQKLNSAIDFSPKSNLIEISTDLTGLNTGDNQLSLNNLKGKFQLQGVENNYDINQAEIKIERLNNMLPNGKDEKALLENIVFSIQRNLNTDNYDLSSSLNIDNVEVNYDSSVEKLKNIKLDLKRLGIPNGFVLNELLQKLDLKNLDYALAYELIEQAIFNNKQAEMKLGIEKWNSLEQEEVPTEIEVNNIKLNWLLDNQNKESINSDFKFEISQLSQGEAFNLNGLAFNQNTKNNNLNNYNQFLKKYINQDMFSFEPTKNSEFLTDLKSFLQKEQSKTEMNINVKSIHIENIEILKNLDIKSSQENRNAENKGEYNLNIALENFLLPEQHIQLNQLALNFPIKINDVDNIASALTCLQRPYNIFCARKMSQKDYMLMVYDLYKLDGNINKATFSVNIDTYPKASNKPGLINADLYISTKPINVVSSADSYKFMPDKLLATDVTLNIHADADLIQDMNSNELSESAKLKTESEYWAELKNLLEENKKLPFIYSDQEKKFKLEYQQKDGIKTLNSLPFDPFAEDQEQKEQE